MLDISQLQKEGGIPEEKKMHFDLEECAGQVLITCCEPERITNIGKRIFVESGQIREESSCI